MTVPRVAMERDMRLMLAMASFTRGRRWIRKMLSTPPPVLELSTKLPKIIEYSEKNL